MTEANQPNLPLLQKIDGYLNAIQARSSDSEEFGPFTAFFRRGSEMPEVSYARPTRPWDGDLPAAVDGVRAAFRRKNRVCRWEYIEELTPDLSALLVSSGFPTPIPRPLMVLTQARFRPEQVDTAEIRPIDSGETRQIDAVLNAAFRDTDPAAETTNEAPSDESDFLRGVIERGGAVYGAFVAGRPVAGGVHSPLVGVSEIAGIGTLPSFRRRGIAGAITSALATDAFERGVECVFLSAGDETIERIYARLGFERIGYAMDTMEPVPARSS